MIKLKHSVRLAEIIALGLCAIGSGLGSDKKMYRGITLGAFTGMW